MQSSIRQRVSSPPNGARALVPNDQPSSNHHRLFLIGDFVFLSAVGVEAGLVMHATHELGLGFIWTSLLGMAAAMAVQMLMAFAVAPLLGSIESMTPSMVVAMAAPMLLDGFELAGWRPEMHESAVVGLAVGLTYAVYLKLYGSRCRRRFSLLGRRGLVKC